MSPLLRSQIAAIASAYQRLWGMAPIPPATPTAIAAVERWFRAAHSVPLPDELGDFWRTTDGIDLSGHTLWAAAPNQVVSGVIDVNELYVREFPEYFFLGRRDDVTMYAYLPRQDKYRKLVMFDLARYDAEYDTFDDFATTVLGEAMLEAGLG